MREDCQWDGAFGMVDETVDVYMMLYSETGVGDDFIVNEQEESLSFAQVQGVDGGTREMNDIMVSESFNRAQRETEEKVHNKLQKSKRVINEPKYLEDFVLD
ncbi:hypothetical protein NDU88_004594 [Pleurodeles waltl]|uniref:Uncharacterized protein n=1 Tax=Pleurodeles waltl TaxID=8319 RepID=A0AAV7V264_PLEWA|nr:hypothetical protein NDU88_004594 [Pleurodeles waltl]